MPKSTTSPLAWIQLAEENGLLELRGIDDAQPARAEREVSGLLLAVEDGAFEHDVLGLAGQRQAGDGGWLG